MRRSPDPCQHATSGAPKSTSLRGRIPRVNPIQLVVMGVSGSGKSTVAALIARRTGCALAAGCPLDDTLRAPWLAAIAGWLTERAARGECAVVSCSALTRAYRDVLRGAGPNVRIVHLAGPYEVVAQRLAARRGHFMPPELLVTQYATLEPLAPDEPGFTLNLTLTPTQITDKILRILPWPPRPAG
jgi:gluconokinase